VPEPEPITCSSTSFARHLTRGAIGLGLIGAGIALTPSVGPGALLLALPGMVALRGCPMCWIVGLLQIVTAGRIEGSCRNGSAGGCWEGQSRGE
jgi:hypothetical protein